MSSFERTNPEQLSPGEVMDDLLFGAELRFGEAISKQQRDPYSVWFTAGTDAATGEGIAWYRLGETTELAKRGQEILDVGIVVVDASLESPVPVEFVSDSDDERHFYVAKPHIGRPPTRATEENSRSLVQVRRRRIRHGVDVTAISDLSTKLHGGYHLQSLRVRHEP